MNNIKAEYFPPDVASVEINVAQVFAGSPGGDIPDMPFGAPGNSFDGGF